MSRLRVVISGPAGDKEVEVTSALGCTVSNIKELLRDNHGVDWAVTASRFLNVLGKELKEDAPVPASGKFKLKMKGCRVAISGPEGDKEVELTPSPACIVAMVKEILKTQHGVAWAVTDGRFSNGFGEELQDNEHVPAVGRFKLTKSVVRSVGPVFFDDSPSSGNRYAAADHIASLFTSFLFGSAISRLLC
jgi:hypothetical protein